MSTYTDQVQERIDRLERLEPAFEALWEALIVNRNWAMQLRRKHNHDLPAGALLSLSAGIKQADAALALAEEVRK